MHFLPASLSATTTRSSPPQLFDVNFEWTPSLAWTNSLHSLVFSNSLWKFTRSDWLCRTQFHLHSLSQWFLTLAPLIFFLIEHQSPKWEQSPKAISKGKAKGELENYYLNLTFIVAVAVSGSRLTYLCTFHVRYTIEHWYYLVRQGPVLEYDKILTESENQVALPFFKLVMD